MATDSASGFTQAVYSNSLPCGKKKSAPLQDVLSILSVDVSPDSLSTVRHSASGGRYKSKIPLQRAQTVRPSTPAPFQRVSRRQGGVV